jgi:hypothetical protein
LLIEEGRTNSLKFSENLTNTTNWTATNQTITLADVGPDGITNSAAVLNEGTAIGQHSVRGAFGQNRPVMGAVSCTLSAFFKAGTRRYILFSATDAGANGVAMTIDTQTWSVTDAKAIGTGFTYTTNRLTNYGGGWYRAELTFTPSAATTVTTVIWGTISSTFTALDPTYVGTSSTIITYGVQLEAGSFATSYIPTTTGSVVRSADVCSITGGDFTGFTKLGEGSVVVHGDSYQGTTPAFCQFSNDTNGSRSFNFHSSTGALEHSDSGAGVMTISASPSFPVKFGAARNQSGGIRLFYNGVAGAISAFTTNGVQTRMLIGNSGIGLPLNGCIRSIKHFKKRLSDAKMQTLTAP